MNDFVLTATEFGSPQIDRIVTAPGGRKPIKHLLFGEEDVVRLTIHRLHVLSYAHATDWSPLLVLPQQQICFTPKPNETMSTLIKYLSL